MRCVFFLFFTHVLCVLLHPQERDKKVSTLTHQKWSGAELVDTQLKTITGGLVSTSAMGSDNTETQFGAKKGDAFFSLCCLGAS